MFKNYINLKLKFHTVIWIYHLNIMLPTKILIIVNNNVKPLSAVHSKTKDYRRAERRSLQSIFEKLVWPDLFRSVQSVTDPGGHCWILNQPVWFYSSSNPGKSFMHTSSIATNRIWILYVKMHNKLNLQFTTNNF